MNNSKKRDGFIFKIFEMILYIVFVVLGFYLAFLIRFDKKPSPVNIIPFYDNIHYIIITSVIIFYIYNIVSTVKKSLLENAVTIGISLFLIDIITVAIMFFDRGFSFPRSVFLIGFFIQFVLIFILKVIILNLIQFNRKRKDILIIASKEEAEYIAKKILLDKYNFDSIKYICNEINDSTYDFINDVDKVYIGSNVINKDKLSIIKYCSERNKTAYIVPGLFEIALVNSKTTQVNDILVFKVNSMELTFEQEIVKRLLDITVSLVGLIIVSPLLIIVSIIIKLYDKGPIFYKQKRVTKDNKTFNLYKFRTMIVDAEKKTGPVLATEGDPRITPIGRFLRAFRIDEFPQLINVLKGDMSIVGPRPERPFFVEKFNDEIEEFKYRVFVKAGITGLAQILGKYSTDAENKAKYDLLYIRNYSLLLDIKIIFNTIKIMFIKDNSRGVSKGKKLEEIFKELKLNTYEELGVIKVE